ncbi:electron transporter SenC [Novosphingobium marinum]|nr:SCO family protein [Novosphingobium marinum]GGC42468.1 electron transporter SenC [Novosphingobium marinum]
MNRRAMTLQKLRFPRIALLALTLALPACGQEAAPPERPPLEGAAIGGPFSLVDRNEQPVRWEDFAGKYRVVYFGYTFCPDACPMDVQATMQGFSRFEQANPELAAKVQPIFISIDPARDTPERVGEFSDAFSPRLLGLTGTEEQVEEAAKAFSAFYAKGEESAGGYLMDHSRIVYLMGPQGEPLAMLPVDQGPEAVAAELEKWVK